MSGLSRHITRQVHIAPLAVFRIIFGGMMLASVIRFMAKGWVSQLYLEPGFFFTYYGFSWVKPLGTLGMYLVFATMAVAATGIMLGLFYRLVAPLFFLLFTYVELIDVTNYLNHYYFVSLVSLLLCVVPAHRYFSLDVRRKPSLRCTHVPAWTINIFKLQLGIVYFYAGLAKLNPDWLLEAQPLRLWLSAKTGLPLLGPYLDKVWVAYFFSWSGALYDLSIPFLLLYKRTRLPAYAAVIGFHIVTAVLFPIGMFPYIMILSTLLFFSEGFHQRLLSLLRRIGRSAAVPQNIPQRVFKPAAPRLLAPLLGLYFLFQLLFPFRFAAYPDKLFWTEQGYRFSWRVMLMEKAGHITFFVQDPATGRQVEVMNHHYLTPQQEKMMATQPDLILQFAHFLAAEYEAKGIEAPEVRARSYVSLNGRPSRLYVNPEVDLSKITDNFAHKNWLLPYEQQPRHAGNF
ncbi:HTTM domain-containing protein [Nafulsella turpanensis]|uniref:HTTM domain-containing protein n=1 Tax=Nafulsella turpanensis TaxID=1265690 RepID=UPI000349C6CD|nr:HTTM domain-containing protein [Nafulsella turpanensis]